MAPVTLQEHTTLDVCDWRINIMKLHSQCQHTANYKFDLSINFVFILLIYLKEISNDNLNWNLVN